MISRVEQDGGIDPVREVLLLHYAHRVVVRILVPLAVSQFART